MSDRWFPFILVLMTATVASSTMGLAQTPDTSVCQAPALSRLTRHRVAAGETVESIATQYDLLPATVLRFNPNLQGGAMPVGAELVIPPLNGIQVNVPSGASWQDLADAYGVRADLLFELNGCQQRPQQTAFIPGVQWLAQEGNRQNEAYTGLATYPLPNSTTIAVSYGWQTAPKGGQQSFHGGIDLLAAVGTPVLAADAGIIAFAGQQGNYGNLVVVNHAGGRQTRYAHLEAITVKAGQSVQPGQALGTVGATGQPDIAQPHLHFEVRYNSPLGWVAHDPQLHLQVLPNNGQ